MKRIISILLLLSLLLGMVTVYAENKTEECEETSFLKTIGVLENNFKESMEITKGEFTKRVVNLLYPDVDFSGLGAEGAFLDVDSKTKNGAYIKAAKSLGIVNGGANNMFYPDSLLNSTDAMVIACNSLGFSIYAKEMGGYPTGYLTVAVNKGLMKNGLSVSDKADGKFVAKLLYNMLFIFPVSVDNISVDGIEISENRISVLETVYNIKKYDVTLVDNGITSIYGTGSFDEAKCVFEDNKTGNLITAYSDSSSVKDHLGSKMNLYVLYNEEKGRSEVVNYSLSANCEEYIINADRVIKFDENGIEYEEDKNSEKTIKISFKSTLPSVVLNGVLYSGYNINTVVPQDGFLRIPVNNGEVSLVEVISFNVYDNTINGNVRNIVVDTFDFEEGYINCRLSPANSLKFEDEDIVKFVGINDNSPLFIKKGDIIQFGHFPQSQSEETEFHAVGNNIYLDNKENKVYKQFCENFASKEDKYFNRYEQYPDASIGNV